MRWAGKKVVIIGAARQGLATAKYLARHGARPVLTDARSAEELAEAQAALAGLPVEWALGGHPLSLLNGADLVCLSGGVPSDIELVRVAKERNIPISNDSQLFLELAPCRVVGITGSAGKTTTTTLVGRMLTGLEGYGVRKVWVGGNIGRPLLADVDEMQADDIAVMELSSFQLEWMTRAPHVAAILNLAPNHLDRHADMDEYIAAKARILEHQTSEDIAVLNREDSRSWPLAEGTSGHGSGRVQGSTLWFTGGLLATGQHGVFVRAGNIWLRDARGEHELLPLNAIELRGEHNLLNVLAACALAAAAGARPQDMLAGLQGFHGAPHRLEFVRSLRGVEYYNDSIATAPQRAEAAVNAFGQPLVLLLGGRDKALDWSGLVHLAAQRASRVVLFGQAAPMLEHLFAEGAPQLPRHSVHGFDDAVQLAAAEARPGEVVLLAPGATSFDEFKDFEARGERFRQLVSEL
ncbi:MAG: UDP-N-acetylmuramoyl-L-alanine--D-glutamate ligase [Anaerolineales bacterium]|nr:UDP-N-acetylmuramoyl-L-alanine--D-glutamate ligase [Anaerolineales bacterium]